MDIGRKEYITLMAFLSSLGALSIDCMLPALDVMGHYFKLVNPNHSQYIITSIFFGMMIGQFIYGPLSDAYGRKKPLYIGLSIFLVGSLLSIVTQSFTFMIFSRFLQGLGVSSTRIITTAMIRDEYKGEQMAKIISLIMMVFVIVPALAPLLGEVILSYFNWQVIFYSFFILGLFSLIWFSVRTQETLAETNRIPLSWNNLKEKTKEILKTKDSMLYTLASGFSFGAFIGYLASTAQIFDTVFSQKENFPYLFGILALAIGAASFANSKLVEKMGMFSLVTISLRSAFVSSCLYLILIFSFSLEQNLIFFMLYMIFLFFNIGIQFGNFNSMALEPLGHIAGIGSAVISSIQSFLSIILGTIIGQAFNGTVYPLIVSFALLSLISLFILPKPKRA